MVLFYSHKASFPVYCNFYFIRYILANVVINYVTVYIKKRAQLYEPFIGKQIYNITV